MIKKSCVRNKENSLAIEMGSTHGWKTEILLTFTLDNLK